MLATYVDLFFITGEENLSTTSDPFDCELSYVSKWPG